MKDYFINELKLQIQKHYSINEELPLKFYVMFDKDEFIDQCKKFVKLEDGPRQIKSLLKEALVDTARVIEQLGEPNTAGFEILYRADDLTIINFVWAPGMELHPHNHNIWAVIGIYFGAEENTFYVRKNGEISQHSIKNIGSGDVVMLGENVIHSVRNSLQTPTGGLHVYGGDFVEVNRSEWDMTLSQESPYNIEHTKKIFADANKQWKSLDG
jgi:predicted metal-dependent enzyme (double-stranded beta helix superfamily)